LGITSLPYGCAAVICRELVARWDKGWPPLPLTLLVLLILDGATLWLLLRWSGNGFGWDDRHRLALIVGFLSFFIVFDFLQDADEWQGRGIVGVVAIVAFWRLAQEVNGRYAVVAKRADEAKLRV
jgi:hypothetical protein